MSAAVTAAVPVASFVDRVGALLERVDYRRAETSEDKEAIYRLRYDAYLREEAISPNFSRRFTDPFDEAPNALTFGVYVDGQLASSIRFHVTTPESRDIPALHVFSDVLMPDIKAGKIFVDPTRFVADRACSRRHPELAYVTLRLAWMACEYFRADYMLATVRSEHQAFYKRLWGHQTLCPARPYPTLSKPIACMTLDYPAARERVHHRYPFFHSAAFERRMLFERSLPMQRQSVAA